MLYGLSIVMGSLALASAAGWGIALLDPKADSWVEGIFAAIAILCLAAALFAMGAT